MGAHAAGLIGPNAILRVAEALPARVGRETTHRLFDHAALGHRLREPPQGMVPEDEVRRLHAALRDELGVPLAREIAREAGQRTGDYLLAHRIPKPVQGLLKCLPARAAAAVLLSAIRRHAWTFAGSGRFTARNGRPVVLSICGNPLCQGWHSDDGPACDFYAATFERLFAALLHPRARVREVACEACGEGECRFEVGW